MHSQTTDRFWKCFDLLPKEIQKNAKRTYKMWSDNPNHPSLHFKQIHKTDPIYSVRLGLNYRAIGVKDEATIVWFGSGHMKHTTNLSHNCNGEDRKLYRGKID